MTAPVHRFDVSLEEARSIQHELRQHITTDDVFRDISSIEIVGGADVAFITNPADPASPASTSHGTRQRFRMHHSVLALAGIVMYDIRRDRVVSETTALAPVTMPYIPGYLSFREGPAVLAAFSQLSGLPDAMLYDGCGIAHPRGIGLAAHMGVLTGIPSVGCAKSRLCGDACEPGPRKGSRSELRYRGNPVGACVRTRNDVRPVFVSPGTGFSIDTAVALVIACTGKYRLPEPTRLAHQLVTKTKALMGHPMTTE